MLFLLPAATVALALSPGANVLCVGSGPIMLLSAKLAALKGYTTTCAAPPSDCETANQIVYNDLHKEGDIPLSFLPIAGPDASAEAIEAAVNAAEGLIVAIDDERAITGAALNVFMPEEGNKLERVAMMSRYLNGNGMGFFPNAAKVAANSDIWAANEKAVAGYRESEETLVQRAKTVGSEYTVIRAGTLKGGGTGSALEEEGGGCDRFLSTEFYKYGQQDVVNWRLLYDCSALGVKLAAGDTFSGPGFTAALTATAKCGNGDSHRGAVAAALVESLSIKDAANGDYSVGSVEGKTFPSEEAWSSLFTAA